MVEEEESEYERGMYLHPELYGQPEELRMHLADLALQDDPEPKEPTQ